MTAHDYTLMGVLITGSIGFAITFVWAAETLGKWLVRKWGDR